MEVEMTHNTEFIRNFMEYYDYPEEAKKLFTEIFKKLDDNKLFGKTFDRLHNEFSYHRMRIDDPLLTRLTVLSAAMGVKYYSLHFAFLLSLTEELHEQYTLLGLGDKLFYDTFADLRYKLIECINNKGVPGTFVASWFDGFFRLDRIAYGRFQFEVCNFSGDKPFTLKCGKVINPGDIYINMHIPSSGVPLTDEVRLASYKKAYERVKHFFDDGVVIFGCGSWLLYPRHREFLPDRLNIRRFMDDFEIVNWRERKDFHDGWRVFGKDAKLPPEKLPKDTALKKAYAEWLCAGNKPGDGFGLFAFDGEKILK